MFTGVAEHPAEADRIVLEKMARTLHMPMLSTQPLMDDPFAVMTADGSF